jgi:YidC/Oxa1 family membrane protein insertase
MLTFVVRSAVFPLANTSYKSFAQLRKVSPQMYELREKYADDKQKLQEELVKLYQKEKVNPMAGCLPMLVQIPIFFALFKVFSVTIEMRHAPFFGWIHDLSQPDPTSVFNLFGLMPWTPPQALMIGAWPCMMLFFMRLQYYLNPPPQDKTQAIMVSFMPFFITYILSKYASGLVIYWTFSNMLSIIQQIIIMRSMGVEIHLFSRSKAEKELEEQVKHGPDVHPELVVAEDEIEDALHMNEPKAVTPPKPKKKKKR